MFIASQELMKKYDQALLDYGYSIEELVDKASDCLLKHFLSLDNICLVCGIGNNAADGYSLAEKLYDLNKNVYLVVVGDLEKFSKAANYYYQRCEEKNIHMDYASYESFNHIVNKMRQFDVIVDALFGFGLNSSPRGIYQSIIEEINQLYDKEIIAIDIPTGLDCNTGIPYPSVICATKTITFCSLKNAFLNPDSSAFTGEIIIEMLNTVDLRKETGLYKIFDENDAKNILKDRIFDGHKGTYGRVLSITGSSRYKGAALLNVKSSVYSGSGIVTLMSDEDVNLSLVNYVPEATTVVRPPILQKEDFQNYDSILIGCGLGLEIDAYRFVSDTLKNSRVPIVVDADALTIISSQLDILTKQDRPVVLTPHFGEMKRLVDINKNDDILKIAQDFAKEYHVILVLKGPYTIVTDGSTNYRISSGNKAMAVGGMGDTLAGMINSFLGQGYKSIDAAALAVFIHGYCGDIIAEKSYTVLPSKLIDAIPYAMKRLLKE